MRISLRYKILVMTDVLLFFSVISTGIISYYFSYKGLSKAVERDLLEITDNISNQVIAFNNIELTKLHTVASIPSIQNPVLPLQKKASALNIVAGRFKGMYETIIYITASGNAISLDGTQSEVKDKDYYKIPISGKDYVSDPMISESSGNEVSIYAVPVKSDTGEITAVVASVCIGNRLTELVKSIEIGDGMHPAILNRKTGFTVGNANPKTEDEGDSVGVLDPNSGLAKALSAAMTDTKGIMTFQDPFRNIKMISCHAPIPGTDWGIFCTAQYDYYMESIHTLQHSTAATLILTVCIASVLCFVFITILIKPLNDVKINITEIATGNADLTKRITVKTQDEVGDVITGFNAFTKKLQEIITDVKTSKTDMIDVGDSLSEGTTAASNAINNVIVKIEDIRNNIQNQGKSVGQTVEAVNEIASNIESLEKMIENQTAGVTEASAAVEQMIGNINSVNNNVEKMANSFTVLQSQAQAGSAKQADVNEKITQIESQSDMLLEANTAIAAIAEQTNLLAMNAAIEAAHAGEAGKGFSVVADEIRKLSETSSQQSKTIGDQLNKIKESINTVVAASDQSSQAFNSVSEKITETDQIVRMIKSAMEEQQEGSKQIVDSLHEMNDSTLEVRNASSEMAAGNKAILDEVKNLQAASTEMTDTMDNMTDDVQNIKTTGNYLQSLSSRMKGSIDVMSSQIDQFKV